MDTAQPATISLLDAIQFLDDSWKSVTQKTIAKCFSKAQLVHENLPDDDEDDDLPLSEWIKKFDVNEFGNELDSYASVDDQVETFQVLSDAEIIAEVKNIEAEDSVEEDAEQEEDADIVCPTVQEAMRAAETLSRFYCFRETSDDTFNAAQHLHSTTERIYFSERSVQKKITDYFRQ